MKGLVMVFLSSVQRRDNESPTRMSGACSARLSILSEKLTTICGCGSRKQVGNCNMSNILFHALKKTNTTSVTTDLFVSLCEPCWTGKSAGRSSFQNTIKDQVFSNYTWFASERGKILSTLHIIWMVQILCTKLLLAQGRQDANLFLDWCHFGVLDSSIFQLIEKEENNYNSVKLFLHIFVSYVPVSHAARNLFCADHCPLESTLCTNVNPKLFHHKWHGAFRMYTVSFLSKVFLEHGHELVKLGNFWRLIRKETMSSQLLNSSTAWWKDSSDQLDSACIQHWRRIIVALLSSI